MKVLCRAGRGHDRADSTLRINSNRERRRGSRGAYPVRLAVRVLRAKGRGREAECLQRVQDHLELQFDVPEDGFEAAQTDVWAAIG